ncbi:phage minor head protein [Cupriavidus taiwanensis]|uniref:phage head morphogenesis protein n=1 Tax=Cupriavidus taiwanensis TaxID=164546 RepID=UPI00253F6FCD|nr:phage minor head protein [Cupriavidus taiwanensis]MDK3025570.1 phage minor head protein [Cupriavidus taiwanensis]
MATPDLAYAIGLPPAEAIRYFEAKGYAVGFKWQDVWDAAHAKAFTVAGVMKLDVLQDIRSALAKAIKDGGTLAEFRKDLLPVLERKGWLGKGFVVDGDTGEIEGKRLTPRRLRTIFETNMQSAYMAGRFATQMENVDERPYWEYVAVMDSRTRPAHRVLNGRVLRYDDPFWRTFYPPNGYRCRCRVRTRSQADIGRLDLPVSTSEGRLSEVDQVIGRDGETRPAVAYQDPITGRKFTTDPGFGFNAGRAAFQPDLDRYATDVARQYVRGSLSGPDFQSWYRQMETAVAQARQAAPESGNEVLRAELVGRLASGQRYPVGVLGKGDRAALGVESQTVWLSDETLVKQLVNRDGQDIGLADYWRVQNVIEDAQLVVRDGDVSLVFVRQEDRMYHAVIKATRSGKALFLTSFRETNMAAAQRAMRRGQVVRNLLGGK